MKPYITQPEGSVSCGAHSISYYLWETKKDNHINDRSFVDDIFSRIQFGPNNFGINEGYSNPMKMIEELNNKWNLHSYLCVLENSPLMEIGKEYNAECEVECESQDVFNKLKLNPNKYAIIVVAIDNLPMILHYVLVKYEDDTFKMLDSLTGHGNDIDHAAWENFSVESDGRIVMKRNAPYQFVGVGIFIED